MSFRESLSWLAKEEQLLLNTKTVINFQDLKLAFPTIVARSSGKIPDFSGFSEFLPVSGY
jgi:hypothetical protein